MQAYPVDVIFPAFMGFSFIIKSSPNRALFLITGPFTFVTPNLCSAVQWHHTKIAALQAHNAVMCRVAVSLQVGYFRRSRQSHGEVYICLHCVSLFILSHQRRELRELY